MITEQYKTKLMACQNITEAALWGFQQFIYCVYLCPSHAYGPVFVFYSLWLKKIHCAPQERKGTNFWFCHFPPFCLWCSALPFLPLVRPYLTRLTVSLLFFSLSSSHLSSAHMIAHMKSFCGLLTCVSVLGTNTCLSEALAHYLSFLPAPLLFFSPPDCDLNSI